MTKLRMTFIFLAIMHFWTIANAQSAFEKIEFASFDANSPRTKQKDKIEIFTYSKIDRKGLAYVLDRNEDNDTISYYKYQVDTTQLSKINTFFTDRTALKDFMITKSLKAGEHYGGSYNFLLVTYQNGKKDSLCFIDDYMSPDFEAYFKILETVFYKRKSKVDVANNFSIPEDFKKSVQLTYSKSNYLPPIEFPPPPM